MSVDIYMCLFIIPFMLHELEEIAFLPEYFNTKISRKKLPKFLQDHTITNQKFTLIVMEEFFILSIFLLFCLNFRLYSPFLGLLSVYIFHIIGHIFQMIIIKMYIPGVASGIISSICCVPIIIKLLPFVNILETSFYFIIILFIAIINLVVCHKYIK